ncbi:hypothetical protein [Litorihabitans aurantiacus]|uniref:hypothetical protein n=1 Tax=Litorihabitans aurantiacus TaxID=1930061 RepID=UPI0024E0FFE6|nr:hypothetical protein [Litorihabitans aurantiacus]
MGAELNAFAQRWERAGRPWCSHPWASRSRVDDVGAHVLTCQICGIDWGLGEPAPPPRGTSGGPASELGGELPG